MMRIIGQICPWRHPSASSRAGSNTHRRRSLTWLPRSLLPRRRSVARLHPKTAANLADLVRLMNCYYSNLIEGHHIRPRDIERAMAGDLDVNEQRRNLQREAVAHIRVQAEIDRLVAEGALPEPASRDFLCWLHREFYADAPVDLLRVGMGNRQFLLVPGAWRSQPDHDNAVGRHLPPSSQCVGDFMAHFEDCYRFGPPGAAARIVVIAAAHHRLNVVSGTHLSVELGRWRNASP